MSKIAFTTLLNREDSRLSPHFGKAKWVLIREEDARSTFEQNTGLNGRSVIDILLKHSCTDAVFTHIGAGAFAHLAEAGIRGWIGPDDMPVPELLDHLNRGELEMATAPEPDAETAHGKQHAGCGHEAHGHHEHGHQGQCCGGRHHGNHGSECPGRA